MMKRTTTCGSLTTQDKDKTVILNGWVHRLRDHGGIKFVDLRDRYGLTQVVIDPEKTPDLKNAAEQLKFEYCIAVKGLVVGRPDNMVNPHRKTGAIEVQAQALEILSRSNILPFMIDERSDAKEELRFKYRYLDLRSFSMQEKIKLRHQVSFAVRDYLTREGFYEIETPTLIKSTPEGARDFLVPCRLQPGKFYALPQSPQLYKQILMVSGFDKYFQLAHCFRDEDARGDRQPEHTQIDIEMSFVDKEDIFSLIEGLFAYIFQKILNKNLPIPFARLAYDDAMNRYGSDKPDLRFDMAFQDFDQLAVRSEFQVFKSVLDGGGCVKALRAPRAAEYSRKQIADLEELAKVYGAQGLAWMKVTAAGLESGISRFFTDLSQEVIEYLTAEPGDLLLFMAADWRTACTALGAVRNQLGRDLHLYDPSEFKFCWVIDFPLFEYNQEEKKWDPAHHMFSLPQEKYWDSLESDPGAVKGELYDLVCNGLELASGSIRIHDPKLQQRIFNIVGFPEQEAKERFGFLLEAFQYGPPPHGGIAPGLDRLLMLLTGENTIREVIPFPKNSFGISPMDDCPSRVEAKQLAELNIKINSDETAE